MTLAVKSHKISHTFEHFLNFDEKLDDSGIPLLAPCQRSLSNILDDIFDHICDQIFDKEI